MIRKHNRIESYTNNASLHYYIIGFQASLATTVIYSSFLCIFPPLLLLYNNIYRRSTANSIQMLHLHLQLPIKRILNQVLLKIQNIHIQLSLFTKYKCRQCNIIHMKLETGCNWTHTRRKLSGHELFRASRQGFYSC